MGEGKIRKKRMKAARTMMRKNRWTLMRKKVMWMMRFAIGVRHTTQTGQLTTIGFSVIGAKPGITDHVLAWLEHACGTKHSKHQHGNVCFAKVLN